MAVGPLAAQAVRGQRRLTMLTAIAVLGLGAMLSVFGVAATWGLLHAVRDQPALAPCVVGGLALGFCGAGAFVLAELRNAKRPVEQFLAEAVDRGRAGEDHRRVQNLADGIAIAAGVEAPTVYLVQHACPNALAIGLRPESTDLYVTTGLLRLLNRDEQEAVLASIITSIGCREVALGTVGYGLASGLKDTAGTWLRADRLSLGSLIAAPFWLVGLTTRRLVLRWKGVTRDAAAMAYTRNPSALYTALVKLRDDRTDLGPVPVDTGHLWFEYPRHEVDQRSGEPRHLPNSLDARIAQVATALGIEDG